MKEDPKRKKKKKEPKKKPQVRWILTVFISAVLISATFSFLSQELLRTVSLIGAFLVLLVIVAIGIAADALGVAVTAASEAPFHSMASRKVRGAAESIRLLRNADRVASICNDVIGDICGIISGAAAAAVALQALTVVKSLPQTVVQLALSALVAGLTIGGKAACKTLALNRSTEIVHTAGKVISFFKHPFRK